MSALAEQLEMLAIQLETRAEWLLKEAHSGGNWEHLKGREDECRHVAADIRKLLSHSISGEQR